MNDTMTGKVVDHYRVAAMIGSGGMGAVYLARDLNLDRHVALKILSGESGDSPEKVQRFVREAKAASRLTHPNIAAVYDIGAFGGDWFIAMELVQGKTLADMVRLGALSVEDTIRFGIQLADGLSEAHEHGVVHRDIKPSNLMIDARGRLKILDFGIAMIASPDTSQTHLTGSGALIGTVPYMSPEQALGRVLDRRSDIFAAGAVLYEMATGTCAFRGASVLETLNEIAYESPSAPSSVRPEIPPGLEAVILRCLEKDPDKRHPSAARLAEDLRDLQSTAVTARAAGRPILSGPISRWVTVGMLVAATVGASFGLWQLAQAPAATAQARNLVILPFEVVGDSGPTQAYTDGLIAAVTTRLMQLSGPESLQVVPASEVRQRQVRTARDARTELGGSIVVQGTLHQERGSLRISYTVVDVHAARPMNAGTLTLGTTDSFVVQDRLVDSLAKKLNIGPPEELRTASSFGTEMPGAYDYYLQGRGYLQYRDKPENIENAISVFQRALEVDPDFGQAYAGLGQSYWYRYVATRDVQWTEKAASSCERALALEESSPEPHICLGIVNNGTGRYERALEEFQHAFDRGETEESVLGTAQAYDRLGRAAEAEETYRRAIRARPQYWGSYYRLGVYLYSKGRYTDAEVMFRQVLALAPDHFRGYTSLGAMYFSQQRMAEAAEAFEKSLALRPTFAAASNLGTVYYFGQRDYTRAATAYRRAVALGPNEFDVWGNLGAVLRRTGDLREARSAFDRARELAEEQLRVNPRNAGTLIALADFEAHLDRLDRSRELIRQAVGMAPDEPAVLYRAAGISEFPLNDRDAALSYLSQAIDNGQAWWQIERSPTFDALREDPRFQQLAARRNNNSNNRSQR